MLDGKLDNKDIQILSILSEDARTTYSEIGKRIGLTRPATKNRIIAMEKAGIISGYHADISLTGYLQLQTYFVYIETKPESFEEAQNAIARLKRAVTVIQKAGNRKLLAICVAENAQELRDLLNNVFKGIHGIKQVFAHKVVDVIKGSVIPDRLKLEVFASDK